MFGDQNDDSATFQDYVELILNNGTYLNDDSNMMIKILIMRLKHHVITKNLVRAKVCRIISDL